MTFLPPMMRRLPTSWKREMRVKMKILMLMRKLSWFLAIVSVHPLWWPCPLLKVLTEATSKFPLKWINWLVPGWYEWQAIIMLVHLGLLVSAGKNISYVIEQLCILEKEVSSFFKCSLGVCVCVSEWEFHVKKLWLLACPALQGNTGLTLTSPVLSAFVWACEDREALLILGALLSLL